MRLGPDARCLHVRAPSRRLTQVLPPRVLVMNTAHYYQNTVLHNEPQLLPAIGEGRV